MKRLKEKGMRAHGISQNIFRNIMNANIRQAKRDFVLNELDNCKNNSKRVWQTIRSVLPGGKGNAKQDILLKEDGEKVRKEEVAHHINEFFINVGNIVYRGG